MSFDLLTPYVAMQAVESVIGTPVDGALTGYPSYVNRVYGFGAEDGRQYVAKFYRPGRWSRQAIAEEHHLLAACAAEELPVVAPLADGDGDGETLHAVICGQTAPRSRSSCLPSTPSAPGATSTATATRTGCASAHWWGGCTW